MKSEKLRFVCLIITTLLILTYFSRDFNVIKSNETPHIDPLEHAFDMKWTKKEMERRLNQVSNVCKGINNKKKYGRSRYSASVFHVKQYNVSYCGVGKAGGTFMKQFLSILAQGTLNSKELENFSRLQVHKKTDHFLNLSPKSKSYTTSKVIGVARDPWSRLFSAYIDRVFLPSITKRISKTSKCQFDFSFDEFLQFVVKTVDQGKIDPHWSPIYYICKPCVVKPAYVVKLESFTNDIHYVSRDLQLDQNKTNAINRLLQSARLNWTITGIVKEVMENANKEFTKPGCIGWTGAIKRLWKAFQIQGYINDRVNLTEPPNNAAVMYSNISVVLHMIMNTIEKHPMSRDEARLQRRKALVKAYDGVNLTTIKGIQRVFEPDFEIFGYSNKPPKK